MNDRRSQNGLLRALPPICLALALASATAGPGFGQQTSTSEHERVERGRLSYRVYCLNCHGPAGRGEGPMAKLLRVAPPDLTRLSRRNGGEFPAERVYRTIDGREEIGSHGGREMPIWGMSFQDLSRDSDQEEEVRGRILDLVSYLESMQEGRHTVVER